jgi:hypothetical protein
MNSPSSGDIGISNPTIELYKSVNLLLWLMNIGYITLQETTQGRGNR